VTIPPSIAIPGISVGAAVAGLPRSVLVLCVVATVVQSVLAGLAPAVLAYLTGRHQVRLDDSYRKDLLAHRRELLAATLGLPDSERATVLCELARALNQSGSPPPTDPTDPDRAP